MKHTCHARGCNVPVPPQMLLCKPHWFLVPLKIRNAVWQSYRVGQCDDRNPSEAWHEAADAAIGYVASLEGQVVRSSEYAALRKFGFELQKTNGGPRFKEG